MGGEGVSFPLVAVPKTYRAERKAKKRKAERQFALTRAQVRAIVMDREKGCCERCGRKVDFDVAPYLDHHAEVHEDPPRSLGGDPLDPKQCVLLCRSCHFSGASGGHIGRGARG
jgi:5-methylcytosine-specific restriction endonuclease McrA